MSDTVLVAALLALDDPRGIQAFLEVHRDELTSSIILELERQADRARLEDPLAALRAANVMFEVATFLADDHSRANAF